MILGKSNTSAKTENRNIKTGTIGGSSAFSLPKSTLSGFTSRGNNAKNESTTSVRYLFKASVPQDPIAQHTE